ncbi:hypothetical protein CL628_03560 [bacterium]|nr:hypothetical protein [bacterium]|tara:strand:- start:150 stop:353 length:204 start_codon:yes stop_codon:yes gene_type:complete
MPGHNSTTKTTKKSGSSANMSPRTMMRTTKKAANESNGAELPDVSTGLVIIGKNNASIDGPNYHDRQ